MEWLIQILAWILVSVLAIGLPVFIIEVVIMLWKAAKGKIVFINPALPWLGAVEVKRRKRENRDSLEPKPRSGARNGSGFFSKKPRQRFLSGIAAIADAKNKEFVRIFAKNCQNLDF